MTMPRLFLALNLLVAFFYELTFAQSLSQNLDSHGLMDWESMIIRTTGNSAIVSQARSQKLQALEQAKIAAIENLLKAVKGLSYDANSKIRDVLLNSASLQSKLKNAVRMFTIVDTRSMSDMSVEIDIELSVTEHLSSLLLPKHTGRAKLRLSDQPLCPTCGQPWPEKKPVPKGLILIIPSEGYSAENGRPYTGLVIDATGLSIHPTLLPKVLNEENEEIYGINYVNREAAVASGLVSYKRKLDEALNEERVGSQPLMIRALGSAGKSKSDVIISNNDAILIHAAAKTQNFLRDCKVIIIVG